MQMRKWIRLIKIFFIAMILINFTTITTYIYEYKNNFVNGERFSGEDFSQSLKNKKVYFFFSDSSVKIVNCYKLTKKEQVKTASFIVEYLDSNNIYYARTINNFVAELSLHSRLYKLGIAKTSTKDADLEFIEDSRWYVRGATLLLQILGI